MNNKNFKTEIENSAKFQKELDSRLETSRQIIVNLYNKHFCNYDIRIVDAFAWINQKVVVVNGKLSYLDLNTKKYVALSSVYYSNDVRGIAKQARKDFYKAIQQQATDKVAQIDRDIQMNKQKLAYHQRLIGASDEEQTRQRKLIARSGGKKTRNMGTEYRPGS